eukprot:9598900-Heterocapsa_arctica.AAC.1
MLRFPKPFRLSSASAPRRYYALSPVRQMPAGRPTAAGGPVGHSTFSAALLATALRQPLGGRATQVGARPR